jgi:hypothetical protein
MEYMIYSLRIRTISYKVKLSHYRPKVAYRMSSIIALLFLNLSTRRGWVVSTTHLPLYTQERQEAGWAPGPVWTCAKNLAPTGIRYPDCPARSQSLYRLRYPAPLYLIVVAIDKGVKHYHK